MDKYIELYKTLNKIKRCKVKSLQKWSINGEIKVHYRMYKNNNTYYVIQAHSFTYKEFTKSMGDILYRHPVNHITMPTNQMRADLLKYEYDNNVVISGLPYKYKVSLTTAHPYKFDACKKFKESKRQLIDMLGGKMQDDTHKVTNSFFHSYTSSVMWIKDDETFDMIRMFLTIVGNTGIKDIKEVVKKMK